MYDPIHRKQPEKGNPWRHRQQICGCQRVKERGSGGDCEVMGFLCGRIKNVLELDSGDGYMLFCMYIMLLN